MRVLFFAGLFLLSSLSKAQTFSDMNQALLKDLHHNLRKPNAENPYFHAVPSPKFEATYLWDSAFIALVWNAVDSQMAFQILQSVLYNQERDGRIPLMKSAWGESPLIQPPILTWSALQISRDPQQLQKIFPALVAFHDWIDTHRRTQGGLYFWQHPYESGVDNSPRASNRDETKMADPRQMQAVDLSSYMVIDAECLAQMARLLGDPISAQRFRLEAQTLKQKIAETLWDPEAQMFNDLWPEGRFSKVPSIMSYLPLLAGVGTDSQHQHMINDLMDPEKFQTRIPFPSVARNSKSFEKDCWRGPVWINMAFMMIQGLQRAGHASEAELSRQKLLQGVSETWTLEHHFFEFYDPDQPGTKHLSRKKATGLWGFFAGTLDVLKNIEYIVGKEFYLGEKPVSHFVGWTGLVFTLQNPETKLWFQDEVFSD